MLNRMEKTENLRYSGDKNTSLGPHIYGNRTFMLKLYMI